MKVLTPQEAKERFKTKDNTIAGVKFPWPLYDTRIADEEIGELQTTAGERFLSWGAYAELAPEGWSFEWPCRQILFTQWYFDARDPQNERYLKEALEGFKKEIYKLLERYPNYKVVCVDVGNFGADVSVVEK